MDAEAHIAELMAENVELQAKVEANRDTAARVRYCTEQAVQHYHRILVNNVELQAKLDQAVAEAAVMREALGAAVCWHGRGCAIECDVWDCRTYDPHDCDCGATEAGRLIDKALSTGLAARAKAVMEVVREAVRSHSNGSPMSMPLDRAVDQLLTCTPPVCEEKQDDTA